MGLPSQPLNISYDGSAFMQDMSICGIDGISLYINNDILAVTYNGSRTAISICDLVSYLIRTDGKRG